ncbi:unnamed protein product [Cunninghamella blakesleeana]
MSLRKIAQKASVFDAFPKVEMDNQTRSEKGGLLTMLLIFVLLFFSIGEYSEYRKLKTKHEFFIDPSVEKSISVNMDLTVAMPCNLLLVHIFDASGQRIHLSNSLKMVPAEFSIDTNKKTYQGQDQRYIHEIIKAASGRPYDERVAIDMGACRIYGSIEANKVAANLHITAAGHGYYGEAHTDHGVMNFTHRIDDFSFGGHYNGLINPLENSVEITESNFEIFQYIVSVVPTTYIDQSGHILSTNQYAVTDARKSYAEKDAQRVVPGIFFKYDIEPITINIHEYHASFFDFLVRLCGIIGGSVVVVGFIYRGVKLIFTGGKEDPNLYAPVHNLMKRV